MISVLMPLFCHKNHAFRLIQTRNDIDIYAIDTRSRKGQRLRGELLLNLKEGAGLSARPEVAGSEAGF